MCSGQPRRAAGSTIRSVRLGGMICTESALAALQVESSTSRAVKAAPGAICIRVAARDDRVAGWPSGLPALSNWTPGKPVSEQGLVPLLVNCRKAYWCPAAPDARSTATFSELVGQPSGPSTCPAGEVLAGALLEATVDAATVDEAAAEEAGAGGAEDEATGEDEAATGLDDAGNDTTGSLELDGLALPQPAASTPSSSTETGTHLRIS